VAGSEALTEEHRAAGLRPVGFEPGAEADLVVVGGGWALSSERLAIAAAAVRAGAELWATNTDPTYPTTSGPAPGTGALVAALEVASGAGARVLGKPELPIFEQALARLECERPLMAGDSLRSDIAGAARAGLDTALILTGNTTREEMAGAEVQPDLVYEDLTALAENLT
jgi:glycerol 3-phosphatase-2